MYGVNAIAQIAGACFACWREKTDPQDHMVSRAIIENLWVWLINKKRENILVDFSKVIGTFYKITCRD